MSPASSREARHRMNQIEILVVPKIKTQKRKLYWYASYRNGYKKWPWIYLSKKTWNSCALPRKVPAMSRFLTKQGSMAIYWRKGADWCFVLQHRWMGQLQTIEREPSKNKLKVFLHTKNSTSHFYMAPSMCKCLLTLLCIESWDNY